MKVFVAPSASRGPVPRSAWPTSPTISPASSGTRGELRPHDGEGGANRRRDAKIGPKHQTSTTKTETIATLELTRKLAESKSVFR